MYLGYQNGQIKFYTENIFDEPTIEKWEETQDEYVLDGEQYVLKDEAWEQKQAQIEVERIAMLNLTAADVERGIYKAKDMDFDDIVEYLKIYPQEGLDIKALKIELRANHFYRGNPYVNAIGALLGFTSEQLDKFFETNDYTVLLPPVIEKPIETSTEESMYDDI